MERKEIDRTFLALQRKIRETQRELTSVEDLSSADSLHVNNAVLILTEQMNLLLQLREELSALIASPSAPPAAELPVGQGSASTEARGRGGVKQNYLLDDSRRDDYICLLRTLFRNHYQSDTRRFIVGERAVKAPLFLACVYEIGIRDGLASADAPVKDFAEMVGIAGADYPSFITAYNTVQTVVKKWRDLIGPRGYGDRTIHLFSLSEADVLPDLLPRYRADLEVLHLISSLLHE